jgi:hypothetical protein
MSKISFTSLPPNCGAIFGVNPPGTILATSGNSGQEIMISGLKDDEITPFLFSSQSTGSYVFAGIQQIQ